jgi:sugar/nucleoside kinase (ribokinase family)
MLLDRHAADTHGWNARAEEVIDVTGAGDAFAGGFLAGWLATGDIPSSLAQGVVSASLVLEGWGSRGLARATPALARARLAEWFPEVAREASREPVA